MVPRRMFVLTFVGYSLRVTFGFFGIIFGIASEIGGLIICFLLILSFIFIFYKSVKIPFFDSFGFWFGWILLFCLRIPIKEL